MPKNDKYFMILALNEAKKGLGFTSPNPMVGAIIVKKGKIIASGYHEKDGEAHAEVNAINKADQKDLKNSTLYVTLEPCCHYGRTGPCTDAIIKAGIKRVVIACQDVDNRVDGNGIRILRTAGLQVKVGVLEKRAKRLNSIYFFNKLNNRPYIVLKAALTLDGKIAANNGDSKWISNNKCRKLVHKLRARIRAIAVGKNTILHDKPLLNCRLKSKINKPVDKLIFTNNNIDTSSLAPNDGKIYLINNRMTESREAFINFCNEKRIDSILIEGGSLVSTWFLKNDLVDRVFLFYKTSFLGNDGIPVVDNLHIESIKELKDFKIREIQIIDNNILIELVKGKELCLLV